MNIPANPGRRFARALIPAIVTASSIAWAGPVYTIQDAGTPRQFEIADDEVAIARKGGDLGKDVKSTFADAVVVRNDQSRVVVRFPQADWRKAVGPRALGGAQFEPVAYEQGRSRTDASRRIFTPTVLASGANAAELVKVSGAKSSKDSGVEGYSLLTFETAQDAISGTEKLRKVGFKADPQLRRIANRRAVPNDVYFDQQWHLQNTGQGNGVPGTDVNPLLAWDFYTGLGVTIAIVDDCMEVGHTDLAPNALPIDVGGPHHDFNDDDDDPSPVGGDAHGTSCAGVAAARGGNGLGVSGGGPQASLLGLRLISAPNTDADEQAAFTWSGGAVPTTIDISSNSWGPSDDAHLQGPGLLALAGLKTATTTGRNGKGVVFCWAGGNGRENEDNVNLDGYANSRYVIAVGAVTNTAKQAYYSESGSPLLVSAPSNGGPLGIFTTDVSGFAGYNNGFAFGEPGDPDYTATFGGTSSATPLVAGIASLVLEANPNLGYRDVMEILATTASKVDESDSDWTVNSAGFLFNHKYGGGMVDATAAIIRAEDWVNLAPEAVQERILSSPAVPAAIPDNSAAGLTRDFNFSSAENFRVEHVEVQLDIGHSHRSDLQITLTSPSGQVSRLIEKRQYPSNGNSDVDYTDGNLGWIFSSTHHWGENSVGTWSVNISDTRPSSSGTLRKARVRLFGTPSNPTRFTFEKKLDFVSELSPTATLQVKRLGRTTGAATVDYYVSSKSSATAGSDFTPNNGTISFAAGEDVKTISIPIIDDRLLEPGTERFYVVLSNPSEGTLGGVSVEAIEIGDDEGNAVSVTASDSIATERNLATQSPDFGVFTISRKTASAAPLTVEYTLTQPPSNGQIPSPGTPHYAEIGFDYTDPLLSATIPAGATSVDVVIKPKDDRSSEGTELVELILTPKSSYVLGFPNRATVNLVDNDLVPVSVTASVASVVESSNEEITFTIGRDSSQLGSSLNVFLDVAGTAIPGVDYDPPFQQVVTILPNELTTTVKIRPNDNSIFNPMKTVLLGVSQGAEYKEGFFRTVEVRIFDDEPVPDAVKPGVTISAPSKGARIDSPNAVIASGTATDNPDSKGNTNVAQVRYRLNLGSWNVATITNNDWTADITTQLSYGDNLLDVYSIDEYGNESAISSVKFTYVKLVNLTVAVSGAGSVSSEFIGTHPVEVGQPYTIVAKAGSSASLFNGWSGAFTATNKSLSFVMPDSDITLTAAFSSTLIDASVVGKFAGLVSRSLVTRGVSSFSLGTSGYFQASIAKNGKFTGKLIYGGAKYSVKGDFTADGRYLGEVPRKNNTALLLNLQLDVAALGSKELTGSVSADGIDSGIVCPKVMTKDEAAGVTSGMIGKYTFQLPVTDTVTPSLPHGTGSAIMTIDAKGNVRWKGVLPDGTAVTQAASLSAKKTWPLFLDLYKGRGVMLGTVTHDTSMSETDFASSLDWQKIGDARDALFPNGFTIQSSPLKGSAYSAPLKGQRVLTSFASNSGTANLEFGNLRVAFATKSISISEQNKVIVSNSGVDQLSLRITPATGALSGTFIHPVTGKKTKILGVVLQKTQRGSGIFIGSTPSNTALQTGRLSIAPALTP